MTGDNDTERDPKTKKIKEQLVILERTIEDMMDALCQQGEKVDQMETEMGKMKHGFNKVIQEFQSTADVKNDKLNNDIEDKLKEIEDALVVVTQSLKDKHDTITLLKQDFSNRQRSVVTVD